MENNEKINSNRLIKEKSPYLLQHAYNPVDWYPWGDEAFEKAAKEDKPIFLSVGYSTCHWCHVMERESFENPEVAEIMNKVFVSIKVDREERPDIDQIYMTVCQLMIGSGGWPLTIIMTPDRKPFFAGTYIPKETMPGRVGIIDLSAKLDELWKTKRDKLLESIPAIEAALSKATANNPGDDFDQAILDKTFSQLSGSFDNAYAGFGNSRKFPTPHNLLFLLRYWKRTGDEKALNMVERTLSAIRSGGIYDHVGLGFHRYSTDTNWLLPHFEKMLYDQALLVIAYSEAYLATGKAEYRETAEEILAYILRDMTSPNGGFYSAEDADSEGEEGKFYIWTEKEIREVLDNDGANLIADVFNIKSESNFSDEATGQKTGENIFHLTNTLEVIAKQKGISKEELTEKIQSYREKLFTHREKRIHPLKDDKILVDWNGLMIAALAISARAFDNHQYLEAARKAADFIHGTMKKPDGRLFHRYREGHVALDAHLNDYAFLIWGLTELYESSLDADNLQWALDLSAIMVEHFWDDKGGGFFLTDKDGEALLVRTKEIYDSALPSGNSVAALTLLRLARLTGRTELENKGAATLRAFSKTVQPVPMGHTYFMMAADFAIGPTKEVVIAGDPIQADTKLMISALNSGYFPDMVFLFKAIGNNGSFVNSLAPFAKDHSTVEGKAAAYVCSNFMCNKVVVSPKEILALLKD